MVNQEHYDNRRRYRRGRKFNDRYSNREDDKRSPRHSPSQDKENENHSEVNEGTEDEKDKSS